MSTTVSIRGSSIFVSGGWARRAHVLCALDVLLAHPVTQLLDQRGSGVDAQVGLDEQFLQLVPGLVSDLVGLEQRADAPKETLARLAQARLNLGVIFGLLGRGFAEKPEHFLTPDLYYSAIKPPVRNRLGV